jgi:diacylglycerol kinase (ATP)
MRTYVIFNSKSGSAEAAGPVREVLTSQPDVSLREPGSPSDLDTAVAEALDDGADLVDAAGGDGTVHAVANALVRRSAKARLGILPLGTGNDLCRTLGIPADPLEALKLLDAGDTRSIDAIRVETVDASVFCLNVAAGGFSGQMQEALDAETKAAWGPLAYLRGAVNILPDLTGYETDLRLDDGPWERLDLLNLIVANGRMSAGGFRVASQANPEDGLADVVIVLRGSLLDYTAVAAQLVAGDYLDSEQVLHRRARRVAVRAKPGMWFSIDGELWTNEPVTFTVVPQALRVIVGSEYSPTPPDV